MSTTTYPNTVAWFEVPVTDITRATKFYETVMEIKFELMEMEGTKMAVFPNPTNSATAVHGALVEGDGYNPSSSDGPILYLYGGEDLTNPMSKVAAAGGKVLQEKISIGEHGFIGFFQDTEGNRMAFHSNN